MSSTKIGFVGFGLIAGSLAHALKESGKDYTIVATSRRLEPVYKAVQDGIVDIAAPSLDETFSDCNLILLCTPVVTITEYLNKIKDLANEKCIISDVGSVKGIIHKTVKELGLESRFIGSHPMAGSEKTGYENSSSDVIAGSRYIITPTSQSTEEQIDFMVSFAKDVKMRPLIMDYTMHDKTVAAVSHLPHLLSTALVHIVADNDDIEHHMQMLAAGSFRDMSRVAASSPEMWEQICITNTDAINDLLSQYIDMLTEIKDKLNNKTEGYVAGLFEMSREYRNSFVKVNQSNNLK